MKVELTLDELCLVVAALGNHADEFRMQAAHGPSGSYAALAAMQHADKCAKLEHRLNNEIETAEHAERLLDNME